MRVEREGAEPWGAGASGAPGPEPEALPEPPPTQPVAPPSPAGPAGPVGGPVGAGGTRRKGWRPGRKRGPSPPGTKLGGVWVSAVLAALVLLALLIFILQNLAEVRILFLGADLHLPLGVALLLAAICGALLVAIPGGARIMQLRRQYRGRR